MRSHRRWSTAASASGSPGSIRHSHSVGWDPPRFLGTAFQNAWIHQIMWDAILGWTGLDQYDESNPIGQQFLDEYEVAYGRRPEYCVSGRQPRPRDGAAPRLRRRPPLDAPWREGGARAGEDAPGGLGRSRHATLVRQVDSTRLDGAPAISWPANSSRSSARPVSSPASGRSEQGGHTARARRSRPAPASRRRHPRQKSERSSVALLMALCAVAVAAALRRPQRPPRRSGGSDRQPGSPGAPSPVAPLFGWTHWLGLLQIFTVVAMVQLIVIFAVAWWRYPKHPILLMAIVCTTHRVAGPDHELGALRGVQPAAVALAGELAAGVDVAHGRALRRHRLRDVLPGAGSSIGIWILRRIQRRRPVDSFVWRHPLISLALLIYVVGFVYDAVQEIDPGANADVHLLAGDPVRFGVHRQALPVPAPLGIDARHRR